MEEDIKILEEFIKEIKGENPLDSYFDKEAQAIEHLIARNKELEEENIHWKGQYYLENRKYIELHNEKIDRPIVELTEEALKCYIPKSKVRELLKEIDDDNFDDGWWYENKIKKLLEED